MPQLKAVRFDDTSNSDMVLLSDPQGVAYGLVHMDMFNEPGRWNETGTIQTELRRGKELLLDITLAED
jgi:hypothetical protein